MSIPRVAVAASFCLLAVSTLSVARKQNMASRDSTVQVARFESSKSAPPSVTAGPAEAFRRRPRTPISLTSLRWPPADPKTVLEPNEVRLRYQGTFISPSDQAMGDTLRLQTKIASMISRSDRKPNARLAHFRWLEDQPVKVTAWRGKIEGLQQTADGVLVRVRIWPDATPIQGKLVAHMDWFYETYIYANGIVTHVGCEDPGPHPGFYPL